MKSYISALWRPTDVDTLYTNKFMYPVPGREQAVKMGGYNIARAALIGAMAALLVITWGKWGSIVVDSGRELYVPEAISEGKRLYFDIWYPYGPLIPYWHALLFHAFGAHVWLLEAMGIGIIGGTTMLIYSLAGLFLPAPLAFVAGFAYLLQAFQLGGLYMAEFNYVLPYSYPAAYATMMFVVLAWLLVKDALAPKPWTWLAAGSIAGLETITKVEFGVSAYLLVAAAILVRALRSRSFGPVLNGFAWCTPGALLCVAVYGWYIRTGGLTFLFGDNISILPGAYFTKVMAPHWALLTGSVASIPTLLLWAVSGLLGVPLMVVAMRLASASRGKRAIIVTMGLGIAALHPVLAYAPATRPSQAISLLLKIAPFFYFNRGMVLTSAVFLGWVLVEWRRHGIGSHQAALLLLLAAGILLASRTVFQIQTAGYSIFYDVLVFAGYLIAFFRLARAVRVPDSPRLWAWSGAVLCCGLVSLTLTGYQGVRSRSFPIRSARGEVYASQATGEAFTAALAFLQQARTRSESFAVWPEEAALYYFAAATAPSRWWDLTPGILPPGEVTSHFLEELDRHNVKYIALSDRESPEYGLPTFGIDYNQQVYRWLTLNFRVIRTFGEYRRVNPRHWAVQIWERKRN